jgi:hypothetical protein
MFGFQLPEQYRLMTQVPQKKKKHKKQKKEPGKEGPLQENQGTFTFSVVHVFIEVLGDDFHGFEGWPFFLIFITTFS